jgi:hypothetical protein
MKLRCAAKSIMLGIERPGPSVEAFLAFAELPYLQKGRGFLYGVRIGYLISLCFLFPRYPTIIYHVFFY